MNELNKSERPTKPIYRRSYILRLWRTNQPGSQNWQASLQDPRTGDRFGFTNLEQLFAFLMALGEQDPKSKQ